MDDNTCVGIAEFMQICKDIGVYSVFDFMDTTDPKFDISRALADSKWLYSLWCHVGLPEQHDVQVVCKLKTETYICPIWVFEPKYKRCLEAWQEFRAQTMDLQTLEYKLKQMLPKEDHEVLAYNFKARLEAVHATKKKQEEKEYKEAAERKKEEADAADAAAKNDQSPFDLIAQLVRSSSITAAHKKALVDMLVARTPVTFFSN
jgi:hypothetical protein